ncbi:MAG: hypothetical protein H0T76_17305 [Nannocystis sp.]|nr:hypothetical protein [Nannocystis sp.]MBA3548242.1 hypothetical protein [Nannocystis sp.]
MLRGAIAGVFAVVALGCGGEPSYVEFAEVCGEAGPVRVLELSPGERLDRRPWKFGERVVYEIRRAWVDAAGKPQWWNDFMEGTVWTTGPCGEDPRELTSAGQSVFTIERWPDVLLACDPSAGEVSVLDPEGVRPPHVVFAGLRGCGMWPPTEQGLMSFAPLAEGEEETGQASLLLHRYPEDPYGDIAEVVPLLDAVRTRSRDGLSSYPRPLLFPEFVLALTPADELVRIGLGDGAVTTVQTGVAAFMSDDEGRYLLWQDVSPTNNNLSNPAGKLFLHDRDDGTDVFLGEAVLQNNYGALDYIEYGIIYLNLDAVRVFTLPGLGFQDLPNGTVRLAIDETHWLMDGWGSFSIVDIITGEATTLYRGFGEMTRMSDQSFDLLVVPPLDQNDYDASLRAEGPLWEIPYEGEPQRLAARASRFGYRFKDGRRAGLVDIGADYRGTLQLSDPATEAAPRIDDGVFVGVFAAPQVFGDDVVVYSIPEGERAGVWIARLPAAP